ERALARLGRDAGAVAAERTRAAAPREAARLTKLVGRIAAETSAPELGAFVAEQLGAAEARVRTVAAHALGRLGAAYERPLLEALARETTPSTRRALLAAVGKVGSAEALAWLRAHAAPGDHEVAAAHAKAEQMIARTVGRAVEARFRMDATPL